MHQQPETYGLGYEQRNQLAKRYCGKAQREGSQQQRPYQGC